MGRYLDSSFRPRASGARTLLVLAGGGLAVGLLRLRNRPRRGLGLVGLVLALAAGHAAESELVATVLPGLLR